ncbi:MAG: hypothetical protein ABH873_00230 [Candidatus Firestonebacteria bacterium]
MEEEKLLIEDKIEDYLSEDIILDEGIAGNVAKYTFRQLGRGMEISYNTIVRKISDTLEASASYTSLEKIGKIRYRDEKGELQPNIKKQVKALNKKLEYHKVEFIKILSKIEDLTGE